MGGEGASGAYDFFQAASRTVSPTSTGQTRTRWACHTRMHTHMHHILCSAFKYSSSYLLWHLFFSILLLHWCQCISAKTYLQDRSVLLCISCRLPYLSDPVVPPLCQQGKVTHEGWRCPLHSNSLADTGTGRWVFVSCLPDSKTLEKCIYRQVHKNDFCFSYRIWCMVKSCKTTSWVKLAWKLLLSK